MRIKPAVIICLLLVGLFSGGCVPARDFDDHLNSIVKPYRFSIGKWELETLLNDIKQSISDKEGRSKDASGKVTEYFSLVKRIRTLKHEIATIDATDGNSDLASLEAGLGLLNKQRAALENITERTIEQQIKETLNLQGIFNPMDKYIKPKVSFPPLNFKLEKPPSLLVISPRDRIESIREILLQKETGLSEKEAMEEMVDKLGVSSLVVELGGLSTVYPTFVTNEASLRFTIDAATEEWLHQYLIFKPLGFLYLLDLLGIAPNYEIATINETLTSMISKEIGSIIFKKYYSTNENGEIGDRRDDSTSFFNREMREIRRKVDKYLAQGEIEQAEEFMKLKRQYLASRGHYIRKLNQAYFAFYGAYADSPTSISPIGPELEKLRAESDSLKDFLETVASMTSRQDLQRALDKSP